MHGIVYNLLKPDYFMSKYGKTPISKIPVIREQWIPGTQMPVRGN